VISVRTELLPSKGEIAVLLVTQIKVNNTILSVLVAHFGETEADRTAQAQKTIEIVQEIANPIILLGDFNSVPNSTPYLLLTAAGLQNAYALQHNNTFVSTIQAGNKTIDYIFFKGALTVQEALVLDTGTISDHKAVLVKFIFP
jgi:endonuclease/exonuclease/phosphatase (EEP) superfamily protein YafD